MFCSLDSNPGFTLPVSQDPATPNEDAFAATGMPQAGKNGGGIRRVVASGLSVGLLLAFLVQLTGVAEPATVPPLPNLNNAERTVMCPSDALAAIYGSGVLTITLASQTFNVRLLPYDIGGGPITIISPDENGKPIEYVEIGIITFQGRDINDRGYFSAFTITDNGIHGMVSGGSESYWLQPLSDFLSKEEAARVPNLECEHVSYTPGYTPFID